jgi:hypothetical protein
VSDSTDYAYIFDWPDRLLAATYVQFRSLQNWNAYIQAIGAMGQYAEDTFYSLLADCAFDVASGASLDQWGELVGLARNGLTDTQYRNFIAAQIPALRCGGTAGEEISIFAMVTSVAETDVLMYPFPPASFWLETVTPMPLDDIVVSAVVRTMTLAQSIGIGMLLIETPDGYARCDTDGHGCDDGGCSRVLE